MSALMNTHEVADYLRIKERKVYELVAQRRIPCTRAAGKWLFPKDLIDQWLLQHAEAVPASPTQAAPPPIIAGSHDPLLDWAVRESGSGLAVLFNGSLDGLERFRAGDAMACGLHVLDPASGAYNAPLLERNLNQQAVVAIEWAQRQQGLMLPAGNPLGIHNLVDAVDKRFALRQAEAGSHVLLDYLLQQSDLDIATLTAPSSPLRSEHEVAQAIANNDADVGLGIAAAAAHFKLDFLPLWQERYDLLIWRRYYFEPPLQRLFAFARQTAFAKRAAEWPGYNIQALGQVRFNSPKD
jgi:excisionase family DNA binding protein